MALKMNKPSIEEKIAEALEKQVEEAGRTGNAAENKASEEAALEEHGDMAGAAQNGGDEASVASESSEGTASEGEVKFCKESNAKNQWQWSQQKGWKRTPENTEK